MTVSPQEAPAELVVPFVTDSFWQKSAACRDVDPDVSFTVRKGRHVSGGQYRRSADEEDFIRNNCDVCPVKADCLAATLINDNSFGISGGMAELERKPLQKSYKENKGCIDQEVWLSVGGKLPILRIVKEQPKEAGKTGSKETVPVVQEPIVTTTTKITKPSLVVVETLEGAVPAVEKKVQRVRAPKPKTEKVPDPEVLLPAPSPISPELVAVFALGSARSRIAARLKMLAAIKDSGLPSYQRQDLRLKDEIANLRARPNEPLSEIETVAEAVITPDLQVRTERLATPADVAKIVRLRQSGVGEPQKPSATLSSELLSIIEARGGTSHIGDIIKKVYGQSPVPSEKFYLLRDTIAELLDQGRIVKVGGGRYALPSTEIGQYILAAGVVAQKIDIRHGRRHLPEDSQKAARHSAAIRHKKPTQRGRY